MRTNQIKKGLIAVVCLLPATVMAQREFVIHGKVGSLNSSEKVYLTYRPNKLVVTDSIVITNGKFSFTGNITGIKSASISIRHDASPKNFYNSSAVDKIEFYLEPHVKLDIFTEKDSIRYASVKGSKANADKEKYKLLIKEVVEKKAALKAEWDSKTETARKNKNFRKDIDARYAENQKELDSINKAFIEENRNLYMGLVVFKSTFKKVDVNNVSLINDEFEKFPDDLQRTELGKYISLAIASIGQPQKEDVAPDFTLNDINGKPVKLSDFRGKYVLLDFWASWCAPCRAENPSVVAAYQKFKDKNFTVLGVSSDVASKRPQWLKAIEQDGLTWTQVADLENSVRDLYKVKGIPTNFLIDPDGKIITNNISVKALQDKLSEVLDAGYSASSNPAKRDSSVVHSHQSMQVKAVPSLVQIKSPDIITEPVELNLLYQKKNGISSRLILPVSQIGSEAIDLQLVFDTGSQGIVLDAKKILPAEMIGPDGIIMNGQNSITVNGITVTPIKQQAGYGATKETARTFYGQIAYATFAIGAGQNQLVSRKMPFLLVYKGVKKGTQLPASLDPFCDGICGIYSAYTSNDDGALKKSELKSPFEYMNYSNHVNPGIELEPLNSFAVGNGSHPIPALKVGVTGSMEKKYNYFRQIIDNKTGYYEAIVPAIVKFNDKKIRTSILFDTGTHGMHPMSFFTRDFVSQEDIPDQTNIEINASGFTFNYHTDDQHKAVSGPGNRSISNLTFFDDHHYLLDYKNHYIGFY